MPSAGYYSSTGGSTYGISPLSTRVSAGSVPTAGGTTGGATIEDPDAGRYSLDIGSAGGLATSLQQNDQATTDFIAGLGEALFGEKTGLVSGFPFIGGLVSGAVRGVSSIPGVGLPAAAVSGVFGAAGNVLSRIPTGWLPGIGSDAAFDALPDTAEKRAVAQAANADILYGGNLKHDYVQKVMAGQPSLFPELERGTAGSLGGIGVQILTVLGVPQRLVERSIVDFNGRLNEIMAMKPADRSPVERTVAERLASGEWNPNQAKDYLAGHASGLSHDPFIQLIGSVLTDPTVIAGFGSGILTKAARTARSAAEAGKEASALGKIALAAQDSELGPLFRGARTVIDPLSALGRTNMPPRAVDLLADKTVFGMASVAYGEKALVEVRNLGDELGLTTNFFGHLRDGIANLVREHAGNQLGDSTRLLGPRAMTPQALAQLPPAEKIDAIARNQSGVGAQEFLARLTGVRASQVDIDDLAQRMAVTFGRTPDDYRNALTDMSDGARAALHMATYSAAEASLQSVIAREAAVAASSTRKLPLERLVVHNIRNMDEGAAGGVIKALKASLTAGKHTQLETLQQIVADYDNVGSILRINEGDITGSIERAIEKLDELITHKDLMRVPGADELEAYPELEMWAKTHAPFGLAFRPADDRLWRMAADTEGQPALLNPWVGHAVGDGTSPYRPGFNLPRNLVGMPVVDAVARRAQKPLDWLEVGANALRPAISGQALRQDWRRRFISLSAERYGMSADEAGTLLDALEKRAGMDDWAQSVRAMSGRNMWKAITEEADLRPISLRSGPNRFTRRDLVHLVLEAYEGDLRYVGLTQAFTGRMKTILGTKGPLKEFAGGNFAGQVSEKFYPMVRFLFHPLFQAQEAIEGPFFNILRGVPPKVRLGKALTESEREAAKVLQNLQDYGIVRLFEMGDLTEYSIKAQLGYGRLAQIVEGMPNSGVRLADAEAGLTFIARQKYINYINLWKSKLAGLRGTVIDEETWLALKQHYGIADDADLAVKYLSEMMSDTMDVALTPDGLAKFDQNIRNIDMWKPSAQGAMTPIGLDYVARSVGYDHVGGMRAAIEKGTTSVDSILRTMKDQYNASDEYLQRLSLALRFDVNQFFRNVRDAYKLTDEEYRQFKTMMENSARLRNLTPAEYLSSMFAPNVAKAERADIARSGAVKNTVALLRVPKRAKGSQADTLYTELARAFHPHMDQSGLDVLRKASGIKGRWGAKHDRWLGEQMRAYVEGGTAVSPDVERALQWMGRWANNAAGHIGAGSPEFAAILAQTAKMDTTAGVPYNFTEHLAWQAVIERIKLFEDDAYRTHYFKRSRTVLERSLNHPFFGLYPASYMWGKVLPELVNFIAREPFGIPTGGMLYAANDFYKTLAAQRELDPEFDAEIERIGKTPAAFMLGYMLPAWPQDVPAVLPGWARELANQGVANKRRRDAGLPTKDIEGGEVLKRVTDYLSPLTADQVKVTSLGKQIGETVDDPVMELNKVAEDATNQLLSTLFGK